MKKLTLAIIMLLGTFSMASAEVGVNVGVSGQMGAFFATGFEKEDREVKENHREAIVLGYGSVFLEKTLGDRFLVGIDYVPAALSTETTERSRTDQAVGSAANAAVTQKVKVDFEDLTTVYVAMNLTENLYIKAGYVEVDINTKETLGTGSAYGNTSIDGSVYGIGYNKTLDNGVFLRAEGNVMAFDGTKLTSSDTCANGATMVVTCLNNVITLSSLDGASGKLSVGKSF